MGTIRACFLTAVLATAACSGVKQAAAPPTTVAAVTTRYPSAVLVTGREESAVFQRYLAAHPDMTFEQLNGLLPQRHYLDKLSFDPASAPYYNEVTRALQLNDAEKGGLRRQGFVLVDHQQQYSMASLYFTIYARDLPVLVTTDSVLHALHRSFDRSLEDLEVHLFVPALQEVLARTHEHVGAVAGSLTDPQLRTSAADVDVYLTVARNLLSGGGTPADEDVRDDLGFKRPAVFRASSLGQDDTVRAILARVASLQLDLSTEIYGGRRAVDWSQFKPRGHYTSQVALRRYFRAMMWLGRADLGWHLSPPAPAQVDLRRERTDAALLAVLTRNAHQMPNLESITRAVDFLVGKGDSASLTQLSALLGQLGISRAEDLIDKGQLTRLEQSIAQLALGGQQIRSQVLASNTQDPTKTPVPALFQMLGQRFVLDSFLLSQVVFDSILYRKVKSERMMPAGLDVMAALGNNEAVALLEPELRRWNYGSNLMAARAVAESYARQNWSSTAYSQWLDALRMLDDDPPAGSRLPQAMQTRAWQAKQLQTQLASWAELRHDTILYAKQSYAGYPACEYPKGYVEPYPEFFARVAELANLVATRLQGLTVNLPNEPVPELAPRPLDTMVTFWKSFATTTQRLQALAVKELAGQPFTEEETAFLKQTVDIQGGGSGPPRYSGWYPRLIYGGSPDKWEPVVADVHTNPRDAEVLEVAAGSPVFIVAAIDNDAHRAVYVGPVSTYYEFKQPVRDRMTDEQWRQKLTQSAAPARPPWVSGLLPPGVKRETGR